jgi:hypothetical protein
MHPPNRDYLLDRDYHGQFVPLDALKYLPLDVAETLFFENGHLPKYAEMNYEGYPITDANLIRVLELDEIVDEINGYQTRREFPLERLISLAERANNLIAEGHDDVSWRDVVKRLIS